MNAGSRALRRTTRESFEVEDETRARYTVTQTTIWRRRDESEGHPGWEPLSVLHALADGTSIERLEAAGDTFLAQAGQRRLRLRRL